MLKQISMRVPKEFYETVNQLSRLDKQEKSFIVREALKEGLERLSKERAIALYKERKLSLSEAAKLADISIGEMMELLIEAGVKSGISIEDFEKSSKVRIGL